MMRKRLISLHYTSWPKIGGLEIAVEELAIAACKFSGWESVLVCGNDYNDQRRYAKLNNFSRISIPEISTDHIENRRIFQEFKEGQNIKGLNQLSKNIINILKKIIRPNDLLISFNCFSLPYNIALTSALWEFTSNSDKIKHITWSYDLGVAEEEFNWNRKNEWPWKLFWEICPNLIYVASSKPVAETQASILGMDPRNIGVVPAGINPYKIYKFSDKLSSLFEKQNLLEKFPLIFIPSKISSRKNIPKALKVIKCLKETFPNIHLLISGSYSPHDINTYKKAEDLRCEIINFELNDNVTIVGLHNGYSGNVSYDDTMSMMLACDGVLFTSRREGFLIPILEANMCNIPIFVPKDESILSWAGDYTLSFNKDDSPNNIAKLIMNVFQNSQYYSRKNKIRSHFSWKNILNNYFFNHHEGISND